MASALATLDPVTFSPPKSRIGSASNCSNYVRGLMNADMSRATNRTKVKGMIDGNAPYRRSELIAKGMQSNTNLNFRQGAAIINQHKSPYYDLLVEVPLLMDCRTAVGNSSERAEWSQIISEEIHRMVTDWFQWDFISQFHQFQMLCYGPAILYFQDVEDWRPQAAKTADILLADGSSSSVEEWEAVTFLKSYSPPNLYQKIRNGSAAHDRGWNIKAVEEAIVYSKFGSTPPNNVNTQEWYQQKFKNADIYEGSYDCNQVNTAHVLVREFTEDPEGSCSHHIIRTDNQVDDYLFSRIGEFKAIEDMVIPFFYDIGDGTYHSINGLGKDIYPYIEVFNRLRCREVDGAMIAATILLQQTDASQAQKSQLLTIANLSIMPPGWSAISTNIGQGIEATSAVRRDMEGGLNQNLGTLQKTFGAPVPRQGQKQSLMEMQQNAQLGKGNINRYYNSLDKLYFQMFKRAANSRAGYPGSREALAFQKRCTDRGVPLEALRKMDSVKAYRSIGAGSAVNALMVTEAIMDNIQSYPEEGKEQALRLWLSRLAGTHTMNAIMGDTQTPRNTDDMAIAALENSALRQGDHDLVVTQLQSNVRHLESHLGDMERHIQEVESLTQQTGQANPQDLESLFIHLEAGGQHSMVHLEAIKNDPIRQSDYQALSKRLNDIAAVQDKVRQQLEEMQQAMAEQQSQQANPDALKSIPYKNAPESVKRELENIAGVPRIEGDQSVEALNLQIKEQNTQLKALKQNQTGTLEDAKFAHEVTTQRVDRIATKTEGQ